MPLGSVQAFHATDSMHLFTMWSSLAHGSSFSQVCSTVMDFFHDVTTSEVRKASGLVTRLCCSNSSVISKYSAAQRKAATLRGVILTVIP
jgi:hypothetical protein